MDCQSHSNTTDDESQRHTPLTPNRAEMLSAAPAEVTRSNTDKWFNSISQNEEIQNIHSNVDFNVVSP